MNHFYVYNETDFPVTAEVEFVPLGELAKQKFSDLVNPGHQRLLCVTDDATVVTKSAAVDGSFHWRSQEITLKAGGEYTHVISIVHPDLWQGAVTRQLPTEQGG